MRTVLSCDEVRSSVADCAIGQRMLSSLFLVYPSHFQR